MKAAPLCCSYNQPDALISQNYFWNKTLHVSDSSSVHHQEFFAVHTAMVYVIQFCWHTPLLCVQWKTPDDGQRNCLKCVEFYSKYKFEKLMHLVGFIIRIYHEARSPECQIPLCSLHILVSAECVKNCFSCWLPYIREYVKYSGTVCSSMETCHYKTYFVRPDMHVAHFLSLFLTWCAYGIFFFSIHNLLKGTAAHLKLHQWYLTLILLTWRIWWAPNNASKWQMGFKLAFRGLKINMDFQTTCTNGSGDTHYMPKKHDLMVHC